MAAVLLDQPEIADGRVVLSGVVELAFDAATLQTAVDEKVAPELAEG
ncbi:MAG: hypothetical protein LBF87_07770 [Treponema sp.]|nr:hypothetical protein [Treponema sp.]